VSPLAKANKRKGPPDIALILGTHHEPEDDDEGGDDSDRVEAKRDAMEAFIKAVKGDDVDGAIEAHKTLDDLVRADEEDEGDEDDGNDNEESE